VEGASIDGPTPRSCPSDSVRPTSSPFFSYISSGFFEIESDGDAKSAYQIALPF